jgi:hypothetical protein
MLKLAPILKKIPKDVRVGGHHGSGSHDWKLHEMLPLDPEDGIGPKSITLTPEMAKHNRGVLKPPCLANQSPMPTVEKSQETKKLI